MRFEIYLLLSLAILIQGRTISEWKSRTIYQIITDRFSQGGKTGGGCDLSTYCGGTFRGIMNNLDYITGMGFNAIWISPVVQNTDIHQYHGYCAKNFFKINEHFGSADDLKQLVTTCHQKNVWVMVDVVFNHVGPVDLDFAQIDTFNKPEYYHPKCQVIDYNNQTQVELCRLANLPDLDQTNPYVYKTLNDWIVWLVKTFNIDGLRVDTIPYINKSFWSSLMTQTINPKLNNLYLVGEVFNGDVNYVSGYANIIGATLDYPLFFTLRDVYGRSNSMYNIRTMIQAEQGAFKDVSALGTFVDNHDNERFLYFQSDYKRYQNALAFILFARGIPIIYYGTEQGYSGGNDPYCREALWNNFNPNHVLYKFLQTLITFRNKVISEITSNQHIERYASDNFYAFSRGRVFVATTNVGSNGPIVQNTISYEPYKYGDIICNILNPSDCLKVTSYFVVTLVGGETKIYYPQ
jgi:alpha-amylase